MSGNNNEENKKEEESIQYDEEGSTLKYTREEQEKDHYEEMDDVDGIFISNNILKISIFIFVVSILVYVVVLPIFPPELDRSTIEYGVFDEINEHRVAEIDENFILNLDMREASRMHSRNMAEQGFFSHESPQGQTAGDRYREVGYKCEEKPGVGDTFEHIVRAEFDSQIQSPSGDVVVYEDEQDLIQGLSQEIIQEDLEDFIRNEQFEEASVGVYTRSDVIFLTFNLC